MDVNTMVRTSSSVASINASYQKTTSTAANAAQGASAATSTSQAYSVEISAASSKLSAAAATHGDAVKGLTAEQVDVLKDGIAKSQELMIKTLTEQNAKLQGWLDDGIGKLNFDGVLINADRFALPAVGTTPEEAAAAIAPGGAYSVDAVADRIFGLASTIANGDPDKLQKMQAAVEEGFRQAGITFKDATGEDDMPQITKDTHAEITKRFEDLFKQLTEKNSSTDAGTTVAATTFADA